MSSIYFRLVMTEILDHVKIALLDSFKLQFYAPFLILVISPERTCLAYVLMVHLEYLWVEMPYRDTIPRCRLAGLKCIAILNSLFVDKDCGIVNSV